MGLEASDTEPRPKRLKRSKVPMSAFATIASKRNVIVGQGDSPNVKPARVTACIEIQTNTTKTSSPLALSPSHELGNQGQTPANRVQPQRSAESSPDKTSLNYSEEETLRLKALLFPFLSGHHGETPVQLLISQEERMGLSSFEGENGWRSFQERAVREVFSRSHGKPTTGPHIEKDAPETPNARPQQFIRATTDLVCATLSDRDIERVLEWRRFFESLHTIPTAPDDRRKAKVERSPDAMGAKGDYRETSTRKHSETSSATVPKYEDEEYDLSSQSFMSRATYAMAWIRFVNTFADRDVRVSKLARPHTSQPTDSNAEPQSGAEPPKEEYIAVSQCREPPADAVDSSKDDMPGKLSSFISLNPYEILTLENPDNDASVRSSAPNMSGPLADAIKEDKKTKSEGTMYAQASLISMPLDFVELRHQCVHDGKMPPLDGDAGLRRMVRRGLQWVWDRHWKELGCSET